MNIIFFGMSLKGIEKKQQHEHSYSKNNHICNKLKNKKITIAFILF